MNSPGYDVVIAGAGISGLTIGYSLQRAGHNVLVVEQADQPGGVIRSQHIDGYLFDRGPNSTLAGTKALLDFIDELGLSRQMHFANDTAKNRYILRDGALRAVPMRPGAFLKSDLLSRRGKVRLLGDLFIAKRTADTPESLADFVHRRLGKEALDYLINPFVAGVYAGNPEQLSVREAFHRVWALEQQYGGLFRGAIGKARERKKSGAIDRTKAGLISFKDGMQVLPRQLAKKLGGALQLRTTVQRLRHSEGEFEIQLDANGTQTLIRTKKVVLSTPAKTTARLITELDDDAARHLEAIPYAPVAVAFFGYRAAQIGRPLDGFGFLVPAIEKRRILGSIWSSSLFPRRAPEGHVALTTFVGGARQPELARQEDADIYHIVQDELQSILGITGKPVLRMVQKYSGAIPQYQLNHGACMNALERLEQQYPGLYVQSNFRNGISVSDCIENARNMANRIAADVTQLQWQK